MHCEPRIEHEPAQTIGSAVIPATYIVRTVVTDIAVDRPELHGISTGVGPKGKRLAERLATAIRSGAVFSFERVQTDVYGKTFVVAGCTVWGRRLNADLTRLGF